MSKKLFMLLAALLLILFGCTTEQPDKDPWSLNMVNIKPKIMNNG